MTVDRLTQIAADISTARQQYRATQAALAQNSDYSQEFKAAAAAKNRKGFYRQVGQLTAEAKVIRVARSILAGLAGAGAAQAERQRQAGSSPVSPRP